MLMSLLRLLELAGLAGSWTFAGYALLPAPVRRSEPLRAWSSALALGAGATAAILTALAALHAFSRVNIAVVAVGGLLPACVGFARARNDGTLRRPAIPAGTVDRLAMMALAVLLLATMLATLAPPSSMDATVYHLRVPREFLRARTWIALEDVHSYQPLYIQMLFAQGLVLGGGALAAMIHWALGVGAIASAAAWGRRLGGSSLWAAVVFGGMALFVWESASAFIDLGLALFSSLALLWANERHDGKFGVVLAGVFAGLAAGCKFTGGITAVLTAFAAMFAVWPDWRGGLRRLVAVGAIAGAIALPWYLRNALLTGNPIFPLAHQLLTGQQLTEAQELSSLTYGLGTDFLHLLTSPIDLVARGDLFDQGWSVGPAYVALCPLGIWASRRLRTTRIFFAAASAWWLIWFYSSPQTRLLVPILPPAAGLASVGMRAALEAGRKSLRLAAYTVVAIGIAGGVGMSAMFAAISANVALGIETEGDFLQRHSWHYVAYDKANGTLPRDAKVAVVDVNNLFYLERDARIFLKEYLPADTLRERGFTHKLSVVDCPRPAAERPEAVLWEGNYPLRFSRTRGGVRNMACARLESLPAR
jgi:hypothetical protein